MYRGFEATSCPRIKRTNAKAESSVLGAIVRDLDYQSGLGILKELAKEYKSSI